MGFRSKRHADEIRMYQSAIDNMSDQIAAMDQGFDEQEVNHEGIIIEHLEAIQGLIEKNQILERENAAMAETINKHNAECLPSL